MEEPSRLKSDVSIHFLNPDIRKIAESVTHRICTRNHEPRCSQGANLLSHSTAGQNTFSEGYFLK